MQKKNKKKTLTFPTEIQPKDILKAIKDITLTKLHYVKEAPGWVVDGDVLKSRSHGNAQCSDRWIDSPLYLSVLRIVPVSCPVCQIQQQQKKLMLLGVKSGVLHQWNELVCVY